MYIVRIMKLTIKQPDLFTKNDTTVKIKTKKETNKRKKRRKKRVIKQPDLFESKDTCVKVDISEIT